MSDKMPDVLDEIIDKLPPSTIRKLMELNTDFVRRTNNINNLVNRTKEVKFTQITNELNKKISELKSKTAENKEYLVKLKNTLEVVKSLKEPDNKQDGMEAYETQIQHVEMRLKSLLEGSGDIDLTDLSNDIEDLNSKILEIQKKISEIKTKYESYDNFPPNIEEAKETLEKFKEEIKKKQLQVELLS